ncbi:MAG TPA: hypothetical protein VFQ68_35640, partial [Streptosporangiaceae bacterium]|nr:hypothetical protein [Streptosporangiaceae bacterium]
LRHATAAGVKRVVMTSAANTASPSSYATEGVTDETLWTDPDDPALIPYRRSKTVAERAAWDFMDSDTIRTGSGTPGPSSSPCCREPCSDPSSSPPTSAPSASSGG